MPRFPSRTLSARSKVLATIAGAGAGALFLLPVGTAGAAPALGSVDQQFMTMNEQTNLAELTLGQLAQSRSSNQQSLAMASKTIADHTQAKTLVTQLAQQFGVSLPTAPNATQQAQAASLQSASASDFDRMYAQIQVEGHQLSISDTQNELNNGTNDQVKSYAQTYLPLAQMHLQMAQAELSALGGGTGVPAGTGGLASTTGSDAHGWEYGLAGGLVLAAGGALALRRRRRGGHGIRAAAR